MFNAGLSQTVYGKVNILRGATSVRQVREWEESLTMNRAECVEIKGPAGYGGVSSLGGQMMNLDRLSCLFGSHRWVVRYGSTPVLVDVRLSAGSLFPNLSREDDPLCAELLSGFAPIARGEQRKNIVEGTYQATASVVNAQ